MLKVLGLLFLSFLFLSPVQEVKPDQIIGVWTTGNAKSQVQIYKKGDMFYGKIIKLKDPLNAEGKPKTDIHNPDVTKRGQPLIGMNVLWEMKFDEDEWNGGHVYNAEDGKEYKCLMRLKDAKILEVRGFVGFSLLGKSQTWTR